MKNEKEIGLLADSRRDLENPEGKENSSKYNTKSKIFALYFILLIILILIFVFNPGARRFMSDRIKELGSLGLTGNLVLILIGIILLCGGFPYTTFEFFLGYCLKDFFRALILDLFSLIIGSSICFILTKTYLKEFVQERLKSYPQLLKFKRFVEKDPWKNLFLMRFIYMPLSVKQYGLPLFEVNYYQFLFTCLPVSTAFGSFRIYLGIATLNLKESLADDDDSSTSSVMIVISMVLTCAILGYFVYFSKKLMNDIEQDNQESVEMKDVRGEQLK